MSNGCGCSKGVLKWFRPPYARKFYVPCCMHDDDYDRGGDGKARREADRSLFRRMAALVLKDDKAGPTRALWLVCIAYIYYISVRTFGRFYFNYDNKEKKHEEDTTMV